MIAQTLSFLAGLLIFMIGLAMTWIAVMFFIDSHQTKDTIRANYPVIGHFRFFFSTRIEFFRQYFFAMDREETPFNRTEREWVYQSAKGEDNTQAFGSTRALTPVGTPIFVNAAFPPLEDHNDQAQTVVIGPYARKDRAQHRTQFPHYRACPCSKARTRAGVIHCQPVDHRHRSVHAFNP